jgi:hypothetical protein
MYRRTNGRTGGTEEPLGGGGGPNAPTNYLNEELAGSILGVNLEVSDILEDSAMTLKILVTYDCCSVDTLLVDDLHKYALRKYFVRSVRGPLFS